MKNEVIDLSKFEIGTEYSRVEVGKLGAVSPKNFSGYLTGIVEFENAVLLFVTLEKSEYNYHDQFEGSLFWWQSQNQQTQESPVLQRLASGECEARLFARVKQKKGRGSFTSPFIYCGRLSPPLMDGLKPVDCLFEALDVTANPNEELAQIYSWRPGTQIAPEESQVRRSLIKKELAVPRSRGQGRIRDYERRRAIERHAMSVASAHYAELGYNVTDTSSTYPFDLRCVKDDQQKRVEVKGTQSLGMKVDVTVAEVESARQGQHEGYSTDLFIVHSISLVGEGQSVDAAGGIVRKIENWNPNESDLQAVVYRHQVAQIDSILRSTAF